MTMNPEIKKAWVEKLRDPNIKQTKGVLHSVRGGQEKFCCLGVLCTLAAEAGVVEAKRQEAGILVRYGPPGGVFGYEDNVLPDVVSRWAGLDGHQSPTLPVSGHALAVMNDRGIRFSVIADLIEREF